MPAQNESELVTFQDWILRVRPAAQDPARLLLLIHGYKGDENSMWVFARGLRPDTWVLAPRALHPVEAGGYSWRMDRPGSFGRPGFELFKPAVDRLIQLVDMYSQSVGVDAAQFDVMGFSQGAAMTSLLALLHPRRVRKAVFLAGFVPDDVEELIVNRPLEGKPVFVAHGTQDEMIPIERARQSIALLEQAGAKIIYCEDEVGHKVSAGCLRALKNFLED